MVENASKALSYILRHHPERIGIQLDEHGWAKVENLVENFWQCGYEMTYELLDEIVSSDAKMRYAFNDDRTLIRANQGHSIPVDVELEEKTPPDALYHGTALRFTDSINEEGLLPMSRLYVHLSSDATTALAVGQRHGEPFIYIVDAKQMTEDGYRFFLSANGVWLTDCVPPEYLNAF